MCYGFKSIKSINSNFVYIQQPTKHHCLGLEICIKTRFNFNMVEDSDIYYLNLDQDGIIKHIMSDISAECEVLRRACWLQSQLAAATGDSNTSV